jgi:predicted enzyme related to lactoylglutathione lyase
MQVLGTVRQIIVPVDDVDSAVRYYQELFGLEVRFQDGSRWAALGLGELTLALAGPGEQPDPNETAIAIKVADLDSALAAVVADGGRVLQPPRRGEHELRASCRDRFGTILALYAPISP